MSSLDPFAGKPYVSGAPGVDARKPASIKAMPAPPLQRLKQAISRIPNASRGSNSKELFLP